MPEAYHPHRRARVFVVSDMHDDAGVDPDFDSYGGELTMAQWQDPLPPCWGEKDEFQVRWWQHKRAPIFKKRKQLDEIIQRFQKAMFEQLRNNRGRLKKAADKLDWQLWGNAYEFQIPGPRWVRK